MRAFYRGGAVAARSATIGRDVRFLRQAALLLPSAFLLDVLLFLLTHGRERSGLRDLSVLPGSGRATRAAPTSPEARFLVQSLVFFAPGLR